MEPAVTSPFSVPTEEDDGSLTVAVALAKEAASLFQSGNFLDCLAILNQLSLLKPNDPKVFHNIIVTEQFQDGCSDPKKLIEALANIMKQSEKLSLEEHRDVSGSNGINEFDTSAAMFNIAVVWFHLHEYDNSFSCLDMLCESITRIRIMDEETALRICLCLLDVALITHHVPRCFDVIGYVEKFFCGNTLTNPVDNTATAQQQSLLPPKFNLLSTNPTTLDVSNSDSGSLANSLARSLSEEEALDDEQVELPSTLDGSSHKRQSQTEEPSSATDLRLKLHLYKVRLMILTRNLKVAKREVKLAMNIARGKDYPMALYLKSQLEYARGNHRKAIKLLMASGNHNETGTSSMYYNNLGCIYYRLGKHQTSGEFFSKALRYSCVIRKEKPKKLLTFSQDKSIMITYNCGVHSLATGRPFLAVRCFQTASRFFHKKPLLWIRIAECCLMALEKGLVKSPSGSEKSDIGVDVIGEGKWRQLALQSGNLRHGQSFSVEKEDMFSKDGKQPDLSMSLGRQCLYNAMYLLEEQYPKYDVSPVSEESESNHKNISNGEVKDQTSDPEYICMKEKQMMMQAALADLAYIELALENPLKALKAARSLLELPECSKMYIFLGTIYAAEALCLLNRLEEAAEQLMVYMSGGNDMALPYNQDDCEKWGTVNVVENEEPNGTSWTDETPASVFIDAKQARGIFYVNYAARFALVGDLEQAHHYANQALSDLPNNHKAILTAVYVDLKRGDTKEAVTKLKQHKSIRLLPDGLALKGSSS